MTPRQQYYNLGMELSHIAYDMTRNGFPVSAPNREAHRVRLTELKNTAEQEFIKITGLDFEAHGKPGTKSYKLVSPARRNDAIKKLFFDTYGLPVRPEYHNKDTGKLGVNKNALQDAKREGPSEECRRAAEALLTFRESDKTLGTFVEALPVYEYTGRVHPSWNIFGARTMRWTCSGPNLQQLQKPLVLYKDDGTKFISRPGIRDIFCAPEGFSIVEADYSQLELRLMALFANDEPLLQAFLSGEDIHDANARALFGSFDKLKRELSKTFVYGSNYGGDPHTIWKQMSAKFPKLQLKLVEVMAAKWKAAHPALERYKAEQVALAREQGYILCPFSGLRIEYHMGRVDRTKVINTRIQHSGSDVMNPKTVNVVKRYPKDAWLGAQVHDAMYTICRDEDVPYVAKLKREHMTAEVEYQGRRMVLPVDIKVGKDWGAMVELAA